jgi:hypothetical protein
VELEKAVDALEKLGLLDNCVHEQSDTETQHSVSLIMGLFIISLQL